MKFIKGLLLGRAISISLFVIAFPALAQTWTQTSAPYDSWYAIASSADGNKLVAVSASGNIYTSTNFGQVGCFNTTWPVRFGEVWHLRQTGANWCRTAICGIYTSTNSGATWTQTSAPSKIWNAIASSADGNRLVAAAGFYAGPIYISTNAGTTWTQSSAPTTNAWFSVDSSVDGTKLAAVTLDNHGIYVSTNSGINWTRSGAPMISWRSIALSADGNKLVAVGNSNIYVSTDSGMTWVQQTNLPSAYFSAVDSSADGGKLVAVVDAFDGNIYTSQSETAPLLNLAIFDGNGCAVSWLTPSTNFVLQQSFDLTLWADMTNVPTFNLTNLQNEVTLSPSNSSGFYRLQTP